MNKQNKIIEIYGLWALDLVSIVLSFALSTYIRYSYLGEYADMGDRTAHYMTCVLFMLFCTVYSFFFDWNRDFLKRGIMKEMGAVLQYNVLMILVVLAVSYLLNWVGTLARTVLAVFVIINPILSFTLHQILKKVLLAYYSNDMVTEKVLVIAEKNNLAETIDRLQNQLDVTYKIIGACAVDEDLTGTTSGTTDKKEDLVKVIASRENLISVTTSMALDEVFINTPNYSQKSLKDIFDGFSDMGVNCNYCLELPEMNGTAQFDNFGDYSVLRYTRFQSSYKRLMIKRLMDIVGGLVGLAITAIVTPFVALAIKIDSPGPVFFSQVRVGRNGRRFKIYKFRSMYIDAEERKKELETQNEMSGLMFKMTNDPRVTKVGNFIRKTSIDELPQFLNIVKGEMSLVGTRPPTEAEFEQYNEYYRRRISMTPGLTGMWQVSGRSDIEDFDEIVKLDLRYIDHWSLRLDLKILWKTVVVVFAGRGAK